MTAKRVTPDQLRAYAKVMNEEGIIDFATEGLRVIRGGAPLKMDPVPPVEKQRKPLIDDAEEDEELLYAAVPKAT